jgi:hypothetical protein
MLPTFILGGTLPAGTGHLYGLLAQHPEVYLAPPAQPECNFFFKTGEYERGLSYYMERWFSGVNGQKARGERSSLLLSGAWVPERVKHALPDVKMLFLLRNPVDRAYANYRFTALAGYEELGFEEALDAEPRRTEAANRDPFWREIQPHAYTARGLYADQLEGWFRHFPRRQVMVLRSDALLQRQQETLAGIFRFLGVDPDFVARDVSDFSSPMVNDAPRQRLMRQRTPVGFDAAIQRLRLGLPPVSALDRELRSNLAPAVPPLAPGLRARLAERFADSNRRVQLMVDFDIRDWF